MPGLGAATETVSNFGQNIRGRAVLVLIDGVPQSTSRNVSRDFVTLDLVARKDGEVVEGLDLTIVVVDNHGYQSIHGLQRSVGTPHFGLELRHRDARGYLDGPYIPVDYRAHAAAKLATRSAPQPSNSRVVLTVPDGVSG